jgi:hypothetical protein
MIHLTGRRIAGKHEREGREGKCLVTRTGGQFSGPEPGPETDFYLFDKNRIVGRSFGRPEPE